MLSRRSFLLTAALASVPGAALADVNSTPPLPPPMDQLAGLALTLPDGAQTTLGEGLRPGPSVISFWASWCAPCLMEARHLADMRTRIPAEQLNIVGINIDRTRNEAQLANFLRRGRVNYTQLRGDAATYRAFGAVSDEIVLPRLFVFAADGRPTAAFGRYYGARTLREVDRVVERALGE